MFEFIKCFRKFVVVFLLPFYRYLSATFLFSLFFQTSHKCIIWGSYNNNRRGDLDSTIKKVSPVEQRLIYQSWYVWIHSWRVNAKRKFYRKASVITEFMNQWGAWFASWNIRDSSISSSISWKHQTYSALISIVICFKIEANQYILNRSGDIHLRDVDLVSLRGGKFDGHQFNKKITFYS